MKEKMKKAREEATGERNEDEEEGNKERKKRKLFM